MGQEKIEKEEVKNIFRSGPKMFTENYLLYLESKIFHFRPAEVVKHGTFVMISHTFVCSF